MFSNCNTAFLRLFYLSLILICTFGDEVGKSQTFSSETSPTQTPRLEDFFWTGSGDGPPPPGQEPPAPPPPTPVVLTTTVLATVYLDSYPPQTVTDRTTGECVMNCEEEDTVPGSLAPDAVPEDRRYWLLTVIRGSTPDSLQLRLARLYQKAFLRQQERHLGIIKSLDAPTTRKKHEVHSFLANNHNGISSSISEVPMKYHEIQSSMVDPEDIVTPNTRIVDPATIVSISVTNLTNFDIANMSRALVRNNDFISVDFNESMIRGDIKTANVNEVDWILATPTVDVVKREITTDKEELLDEFYKEDLIDISLEEGGNNETILFKREIIKPEQQPPVHVHIQNITEHSETGSVQIVYVVLVGGRAVPAAVAARDMRLVRDAEVAKELGATVTTKAEPAYLKAAEGLAGAEGAGAFPQESALWALGLGAAVVLLLVLLLIVLLCRFAKR
ncbi:hypothetical protein EVAR_50213_1 [Eumeta japonica]|uniref:Uncharacterized protein n=1 Tax=Eumeta variegata TaxID=151549 RepID=A0A4C1X0D1_EUMVA|nr:hypothetical protein EVAR_50213_1 [Eumeta japonica]